MNIIKNILITGASSGIGEALALYYAKNGAENLFLCGRNKERLENIANECRKNGTNVYSKILDVVDKEKVSEWINDCAQKVRLHLVFANAGVATGKEVAENVYTTFNINVFGVLNTVTPAIEMYKQLDNSHSHKSMGKVDYPYQAD